MLDELVFYTAATKQHLIEMGIALPPVLQMHNNKVHQIAMDFKHMATTLTDSASNSLYDNINAVGFECTREHFDVHNLQDALHATRHIYQYVRAY
jgi:hypothetical protein